MANFYSPMGSMATNRTKEGGSGDPRDPRGRSAPEVPPTPIAAPPTVPIEAPPEVPGEPGAPAPGPAGPPSTMPDVGAGNPFLQPGNVAAGAPYRTPAFFTNRYVGGDTALPARVGPGTPMEAQAQRPPLDEQTLRALVAQFRGVQ